MRHIIQSTLTSDDTVLATLYAIRYKHYAAPSPKLWSVSDRNTLRKALGVNRHASRSRS